MRNSRLKIIHLASFAGNIGDVANHAGFYRKFKEKITDADFKQLEIRKFYRNCLEMKFDNDFIQYVNQHDLLVLGGGGFFDLAWDYSNTGTTIDFSNLLIQGLNIPVLVNSMGYHEFSVVSEDNVNKFRSFLNIVTSNENWFFSVRNDGSFSRLRSRYGSLVDNIITTPDHGFFFTPRANIKFDLKKEDDNWIGMSISNDLFSEKFNRNVDVESFNELIAHFIDYTLGKYKDFRIVLFSHTPQDIMTIGKLMSMISEKNRRDRIIVAPYIGSDIEAIESVFNLARLCSCVIGMRFHANVCLIGMNVPTIGLAGHEQISSLYDELSLSERCIKINHTQFVDELSYKLDECLRNVNTIRRDYSRVNKVLNNQADFYYNNLRNWLCSKGYDL